MPEHNDPTRELVRWAYDSSEAFDADGGLADVVRRSGRPRPDADTNAGVVVFEPRRRARRRFAAVATFAAAVVTILGVYAASASTGPPQGVGAPTATASAEGGAPSSDGSAPPSGPGASGSVQTSPPGVSPPVVGPDALPTSCAGAWKLALSGGEFTIASRAEAACPPLRPDRVWVLDAANGNGRVNPGDAVIWPVAPAIGMAAVRPPLTFRPRGWPGPVPGHAYVLLYLDPAAAAGAQPGDDAHAAYEHALTISTHVIA